MINGFELFFRTAESQFNFVTSLIKHSFRFRRLSSSSLKRDASVHYHYYIDCLNIYLSPIQLFYLCHFKYPQCFIFRCAVICAEVKEFSVNFKLNEDSSLKDEKEKAEIGFSNSYADKFLQKQSQFFNLILNGGVLDCNLNEIEKDYEKIVREYSKVLQLESISELRSCTSVSQKDFCAPFSMFFGLDQIQDFTLTKEEQEKRAKKSKNRKPGDPDEETEQNEELSVDIYSSSFFIDLVSQSKTVKDILKEEFGNEEFKQKEPEKHSNSSKKKKKNKHKKKVLTEEEIKTAKEEQAKIEKQKKIRKREILLAHQKKEQAAHAERVELLWNEFTEILISQRNKAKSHGGVDVSTADSETKEILYSLNSIRYVWKIFNRLVEDSLAVKFVAFHNIDKNREFLIKCIKFAETCILEFCEDSLKEFNSYEWKWMRCFFKYFLIVSTQAVQDLDNLDFAKKILPVYIKINNLVTKFLGTGQDEQNKSADELLVKTAKERFANDYSVCGYPYAFLVGGIDYTNEKIFETPHPYPRGEVSIKETYYFPKALAVQIRFDPL
jgi:hypothetical protein